MGEETAVTRIKGILWKISPSNQNSKGIRQRFLNSFFLRFLSQTLIDNAPVIGRFSKRRVRPSNPFPPWVWYMTDLPAFINKFHPLVSMKIGFHGFQFQIGNHSSAHPFRITSRKNDPFALLNDGNSIWLFANLSHITILQSFLSVVRMDCIIESKMIIVALGEKSKGKAQHNLPELGIQSSEELEKVLKTLQMTHYYRTITKTKNGMWIGIRQVGEKNQLDLFLMDINRMVQSKDLHSICTYLELSFGHQPDQLLRIYGLPAHITHSE